jgi:hypothetical protein
MGLSVTAVRRALKGADYPASKHELADLAEENGADDEIVDALRQTDVEDFDGADEVIEALQDELEGDDDE